MAIAVNPGGNHQRKNPGKPVEYPADACCLMHMRNKPLPWFAAACAAASLALSSCAYDPYYSSIGGYYNSGYGDGYGYGGSNFSTSFFVSTGDARWGYDPYTYCYYDYRSRRYYDPYLYGYYPLGYRPYAVHGVPHPYGWRPGHGNCPPPRTVRNVTVVNYKDRESAYRNTDYSWARQVRQKPVSQGPRQIDYRREAAPSQRSYNDMGSSRSWLNPYSRESNQHDISGASENRSGRRATDSYNPSFIRPDVRTTSPDRYNRQGSRGSYNAPNIRPDFNRSSHRIEPSVPRSRPDIPRSEESRGNRGNFQPPQPVAPPAVNPPPAGDAQPSRGEGRGKLRSLGEG
jgi:hypothetical protein